MAASNRTLYGTCPKSVEDSFGPVVPSSCEDGFDFTLLFEENIFTVLPTALAGRGLHGRAALSLTVFSGVGTLQSTILSPETAQSAQGMAVCI